MHIAARLRCLLRLDYLQMPRGVRCCRILQRLHRRIDTAGAVRHTDGGEPHLHAGQGPHQGEFVALAEVADAEHFAGKFARPEPSDML